MATRMVTLDERVSHLEGKIDSLATKEDVANLRAEISQMEDTPHQVDGGYSVSRYGSCRELNRSFAKSLVRLAN